MIKTITLILLLFISFGNAQQWYKGEGVSTGSEIDRVRQKALLSARRNILEQAGITIRSTAVSIKGEGEKQLFDIYGAFAESESRGMIIAERNMDFATTVVGEKNDPLLQIKVTLEAQVSVPDGKPDPAFEVTLTNDKEFYYEGSDLQMSIRASKDGFLTIFRIKNDSCFILYPNPKLPKTYQNYIAAKQKILIPPKGKPYSYELNLEGGDGKTATEFIVAVVTKEPVPIDASYTKEFISLYEYSNWLSKIPLDSRCSASSIVSIVKK